MTVFVAVAEEESFAAGAKRLAMSPPAVTRAIAALEKRLGVKLLTGQHGMYGSRMPDAVDVSTENRTHG